MRALSVAVFSALAVALFVGLMACAGAVVLAGAMVLFAGVGVALVSAGAVFVLSCCWACLSRLAVDVWRLGAVRCTPAVLVNLTVTLALSSAMVLVYVGVAYAS